MQKVNHLYEALCQRRDELFSDLAERKLTDSVIEEAVRFAEDVYMGIRFTDFETKRCPLDTLQLTVTVKDRH